MPTALLKLLSSRTTWVVLAAALVLWYVHNWHTTRVEVAYNQGVTTTAQEYETRLAILRDNHQQHVIDTERRWGLALNNVVTNYEDRLADVQTEADNLIADLRDDNVRLRGRFTCPTPHPADGLSETPTHTSGGNDAPGGGLRRDDAEFLIRLAERADRNTEQLNACQQVLSALSSPTEDS